MYGTTGWWRRIWIGLGLAMGGILAVVVYQYLGTVVLGLFLYYAARPIYDRLDGRIRPPNLAAATALLVLVLPVILLFWYTAALAIEQLETLSSVDPAEYERLVGPYVSEDASAGDLRSALETTLSDPRSLLENGQIQELFGTVSGVLSAVLGGLIRVFVAGVIAFYLLRDDDRLAAWVHETADDDLFSAYARTVDDDLQTVFFGNILLAILTGIIAAATFVGLDAVAPASLAVPTPILLGLIAGAGSLIPAVGTKIVYGPMAVYIAAVAATTDTELLWFPAVFVVVTGVVVDVIPDIVIRPYVAGRHLHVGLVMLSYIFGPLVFGWYGLFLGPLLLVLGIHFTEIVLPELLDRSDESSGEDASVPTTDGDTDGADGQGAPPDHADDAAESDHADEAATDRGDRSEPTDGPDGRDRSPDGTSVDADDRRADGDGEAGDGAS